MRRPNGAVYIYFGRFRDPRPNSASKRVYTVKLGRVGRIYPGTID